MDHAIGQRAVEAGDDGALHVGEFVGNGCVGGLDIEALVFALFCQRAFEHGGMQRRRSDGGAYIR